MDAVWRFKRLIVVMTLLKQVSTTYECVTIVMEFRMKKG